MKPIPTITEIESNISGDLKTKLNLSDVALRFVFKALSKVIAGQIKLLYFFLSDVQKNGFPDTATTETNGGTLERFGRIYLNRNPNPAAPGVFLLSVEGVAGSVIRSGLTFKSNDDARNAAKLYITDDEYILGVGANLIEVRSLGGGVDFSLFVGDKLTITEPVIGVDQTVEVFEILSDPKAGENIENYRQLILDAIQLEPQGGSRTDYRLWSADAQGVRTVYPYVKAGESGVVQVFVEATKADSVDGKGTASPALLQEVAAVILFDPDETKPLNERGRIPIQATIEVESITLAAVDVTISSLSDNTTAIQNAIRANLDRYLSGVRPYIAGADLPRNKNDILYQARLQSVVTEVLTSANFYEDFAMSVDGVSLNSYEFSLSKIPYLRDLNFI